jgi:hypothetical protein
VAATDTVDLIATLSRLCDGFNLSRARKDTIREWLVSMLGGLREDRRQPRTEAAAWCTDNGKPSWPGLDPAIHGLGQTENGAGQSYKDERFRCRRPTGQYRTVFCVFGAWMAGSIPGSCPGTAMTPDRGSRKANSQTAPIHLNLLQNPDYRLYLPIGRI